ncbi:MAG TPA: IS1634 family transposase [Amoebophilaceae bacterium]|nr:IS1634 family transposase [Amoebophilaceae bacterium]
MSSPSISAKSDVLDHLGLITATVSKLGLVQEIDKKLPMTKGAKTTHGQRALAMILNGLGFMDDRLYLFPKFLENKPVAKLFGEGIQFSDFHDDSLGRFLDAIHAYGEQKLFSELALSMALKHKLLGKSVHLDTTTLSLYGTSYEDSATAADTAIPQQGYAKNHRFDLKQMTLLLATTGASNFPVWMESHSGNASDTKTLEAAASRMQAFCKALSSAPDMLYVGDSAMYSGCVTNGKDLLWLSRVPSTIKPCQDLLTKQDITWVSLQEEGYKMYPCSQTYQGVKQRWVLIYSQAAYERECTTLDKRIEQLEKELNKRTKSLEKELFSCEKDLRLSVKKFSKTLQYHRLDYQIQQVYQYESKGGPKKGESPKAILYRVACTLLQDDEQITKAKLAKGRFVLATNQLCEKTLPNEEILSTYKEQAGTEAGFKFIKDDTFEVDSIFLKKPGRISALMVVMTLCLMVYSFSQYFLRQELAARNETLPTQSGRENQKPSMKWIYRLFHGVHVLHLEADGLLTSMVINLNELRKRIIGYFGVLACSIYEVPYENYAIS